MLDILFGTIYLNKIYNKMDQLADKTDELGLDQTSLRDMFR